MKEEEDSLAAHFLFRHWQFCTLGCSPEGSHTLEHLKSAGALRSSFGLHPDIAKAFLRV